MADRFDKFTNETRQALQLAQEEAQRLNHNYIGTEHLLLGLIRGQEGAAVQVLAQLGVELDTVRERVQFIIGRGDRTVVGDIGLTPRAKKVIELAVDSARHLNHSSIGPEHLLLGLVWEGEGIAAGVLESLGISMERAWTATLDVLAIPPDQQLTPVPRSHLPESTVNDLRQRLASGRVYSLTTPSLTTGANRALEEAQLTARWFRHRELGTGHLLIGLLREHDGLAAQALRQVGVQEDAVIVRLQQLVATGERPMSTPPAPSPAVEQVLEAAHQEAVRRGARPVGTEHVLLALLGVEGEEPSQSLLSVLGTTPASVRAAVDRML